MNLMQIPVAANDDLDADPASRTAAVFRDLDHLAGAEISRVTLGFSPTSNLLALLDWGLHWSVSPGKRTDVALEIYSDLVKLYAFAGRSLFDDEVPDVVPPAQDEHRFQHEAWRHWPFRVYSQAFLLTEKWWGSATRNVLGVSAHHEHIVAFAARQWLDLWSPSNSPLANPEVLQKTLDTRGGNFWRGLGNLLQDLTRHVSGQPPLGFDQFEVGKTVAITPGRVVFRNHLMELIQYAPTTDTVFAEPILIVPAWIMKYYILDLTPQHSLIRYLVSQGHTVLCISWRNVTQPDRNISLDDYRTEGVMAALDVVTEKFPQHGVHAVGYCIGGTLLMLTAAAMARAEDQRLASITLFAAQTDFTEPGELGLFIDASQIGILESMMWARGVLDAGQMAGAFQILQSNDLVWSRLVHDYLMGERRKVNDLMAWNADGTRMPYRMHSEYLRTMFLNNDLAAGRLQVDGHSVTVQNIRAPLFVVGTEGDRIAPWRSVFKIHGLTDTDVTFVLTDGGHNTGIVCGPENGRRHYRQHTTLVFEPDPTPDEWMKTTAITSGSWWPAWSQWLRQHSSARVPAPRDVAVPGDMPAALLAAPGQYIFEH